MRAPTIGAITLGRSPIQLKATCAGVAPIFLAMRFPCSEMNISEIGAACVFGDDHVSDLDTRIGQWFVVAGGVIALWGFGS